MSKASYIHGFEPNTAAKTHFFAPIEYTRMTDGELSVALVARQAEYLYLGTNNKDFLTQANTLKGILNNTVNGIDFSPGSGALTTWAKNKIKRNDYPAMSAFYRDSSPKRIGQLLSYGDYRQRELNECYKLQKQWEETSWFSFRKKTELRKSWEQCFAAAQYLNTVNQKMEDSGAHLMFSFPSSKSTTAIQTKRVLHKIAVENYSSIFGLSRENIAMWLSNGILAQNIKKGAGEMHPEETIDFMVQNVTGDQVGALPAIIAVIKAVLEIAAVALAATQAIISALNPRDLQIAQANTQGLGTQSFGPEQSDFIGEVRESGAIWPIAAAAAAYIILK